MNDEATTTLTRAKHPLSQASAVMDAAGKALHRTSNEFDAPSH